MQGDWMGTGWLEGCGQTEFFGGGVAGKDALGCEEMVGSCLSMAATWTEGSRQRGAFGEGLRGED